ncbi:MAG: hypothetical protein R2867_21860 [Caldilineaceae bacterium]
MIDRETIQTICTAINEARLLATATALVDVPSPPAPPGRAPTGSPRS